MGNNNIEIGNLGSAGDTNAIRIGTPGTQTQTYIAGISGASVTGGDVVVAANGRLGVMTSSARYKRDIHDIGPDSANLMKLRPVSFRYKDDPQAIKQYGLVAEEVEQLYPELVTPTARTARFRACAIPCWSPCCSTSCKSRPSRRAGVWRRRWPTLIARLSRSEPCSNGALPLWRKPTQRPT